MDLRCRKVSISWWKVRKSLDALAAARRINSVVIGHYELIGSLGFKNPKQPSALMQLTHIVSF